MQDVSTYFRALADRKRLQIVQYLAERGRMTVSQLGEELRLSQPLVSWHLRILRKAHIVKTLRSGRQVWCSLDRESLAEYHRQTSEMFGLNQVAEADPRSELLKSVGER
jgi:DNA-binding transcriptional ArsR family regulator